MRERKRSSLFSLLAVCTPVQAETLPVILTGIDWCVKPKSRKQPETDAAQYPQSRSGQDGNRQDPRFPHPLHRASPALQSPAFPWPDLCPDHVGANNYRGYNWLDTYDPSVAYSRACDSDRGGRPWTSQRDFVRRPARALALYSAVISCQADTRVWIRSSVVRTWAPRPSV